MRHNGDEGFTLVEAAIALLISAFLFVAVAIAITRTLDSVADRELEQTGAALTTEAIEQARLIAYGELAHDPADATLGGRTTYDPDGPGPLASEPLVFDADVGLSPHTDLPENFQDVDFTVSRFITWIDDPATVDDGDPDNGDETQDYKRVTVVTEWTQEGQSRTARSSSIVSPTANDLITPSAFDLTPDTATASGVPGATLVVPIDLVNDGDVNRFNTLSVPPASWTIDFYWDKNSSDTLDGGDFKLVDTNADAKPDTGPVNASSTFPLLAVLQVDAAAEPDTYLIQLVAEATSDGAADITELTVTIGAGVSNKYYLHHVNTPPTAHSPAVINNGMNAAPPSESFQYNFSNDMDSLPGRQISRGGTVNSTSPPNMVNWVFEAPVETDLTGTLHVELHVAIDNFQCKKSTNLSIFVRHKATAASASGTPLGAGSISYSAPNGGSCSFELATVDIPVAGTVPAGDFIEIKIVSSGQRDAMVAYDSIGYPSFAELG